MRATRGNIERGSLLRVEKKKDLNKSKGVPLKFKGRTLWPLEKCVTIHERQISGQDCEHNGSRSAMTDLATIRTRPVRTCAYTPSHQACQLTGLSRPLSFARLVYPSQRAQQFYWHIHSQRERIAFINHYRWNYNARTNITWSNLLKWNGHRFFFVFFYLLIYSMEGRKDALFDRQLAYSNQR